MKRVSRRQVLRGAAATAAVMALHVPSVHAQRRGQTLRFGAQADLRVLDPFWTTAYITRNHGYLVYDTDEALRIKPQMVDHVAVSKDSKASSSSPPRCFGMCESRRLDQHQEVAHGPRR